jgi:hypothetical protein
VLATVTVVEVVAAAVFTLPLKAIDAMVSPAGMFVPVTNWPGIRPLVGGTTTVVVVAAAVVGMIPLRVSCSPLKIPVGAALNVKVVGEVTDATYVFAATPAPVTNWPGIIAEVFATVIVVLVPDADVVLIVLFPASPVTGPKVNWVPAATVVFAATSVLSVNVVGPVMDVITELAGMFVPETVSPSTRPRVVGTVMTFVTAAAATMVF